MLARDHPGLVLGLGVAAVLAAVLLRWLFPHGRGLTLYFGRSTRYVPGGVIGFWITLAAAAALLLLAHHGRR